LEDVFTTSWRVNPKVGSVLVPVPVPELVLVGKRGQLAGTSFNPNLAVTAGGGVLVAFVCDAQTTCPADDFTTSGTPAAKLKTCTGAVLVLLLTLLVVLV
jgi:hypothetical protein